MIFFTLILLAIMEVSLSFDNAVINASVLRDMPMVWQKRFLTWGMPVAVIGMRFAFPILIVALSAGLPIQDILQLALHDPAAYAEQLKKGHVLIGAFGGVFLMMTFFSFHCDEEKETHWLPFIEKPLRWMHRLQPTHLPEWLVIWSLLFFADKAIVGQLLAGFLIAYWTFIILDMVNLKAGSVMRSGLTSFLYLEVLDASCSLDGVIAAFVLTDNILVIMIGLGIGALAIRSLTLYLVRGGMMKEYIYLEHGAHWGIGALAAIMLVDIFHPVPEPITGMLGISFIGLSLISSIRHQKKVAKFRELLLPKLNRRRDESEQ